MITKKYYKLVKVSYADSDYFRVTNVSDQTGTLTVGGSSNLSKNLEYSTDGVNWTTAATNAPFSLTVPAGANVYMRGTNSSMSGKTINMDVNHTVGGNVYSLLDKTNYGTLTASVGQSEFNTLFANNSHLIDASQMTFGNVTTLKSGCYGNMFAGCSALTKAPELAAPILVNACYNGMFYNCRQLQYVKCLAEDISTGNPTNQWLEMVSGTGTFVKSPNMESWPRSTSGIPSGWTVVNA